MAGNQNSGGMRPTAPQNNPANVNALGGNGQSGQPNPNYTGFPYGQNGQLEAQAGGAQMAATPPTPRASKPTVSTSGLHTLPSLNDLQPTGKHVSDGVNFGRGAGSEALPNAVNPDRRQIENADLIARYMPDLLNATRLQDAPDSYKRFINYLKAQL
jgi:hypothetical protein